ncbi:hypothetical protein [Amycolatopsis granulosa]|uniref:hypothetical protein n=1 Tax=Amycolatopsis granulosa TaxID=185684 RepID=UPI001421B2C3|nr:hypothetical protein [Amycolatopsis granulosa]NIH83724.1 hypothetical protein [Amycolatopsis granulosa]
MLFAGERDEVGADVVDGGISEREVDGEVELVAFAEGVVQAGVGEIDVAVVEQLVRGVAAGGEQLVPIRGAGIRAVFEGGGAEGAGQVVGEVP